MTGAAPAATVVRFEMGYTPEEFCLRLPAVAPVVYDPAAMRFDHIADGKRWSVRLIDPRVRAIASIRLPTVDVEFVFKGYAQPEIDAILARFHAHFRRGGG